MVSGTSAWKRSSQPGRRAEIHTIELSHATSTGHRIPGHEDGRGKCARLHGHTFGYFVQLSAETLNEIGLVADFGRIKAVIDRWDHHTLLWVDDPLWVEQNDVEPHQPEEELGVIRVPFVPTSENMAVALAHTLIVEFDNLVFASVEVRESPLTTARFYCSRDDARRDHEQTTMIGEEKWPGEK